MSKNLVRKIYPLSTTSWTAPAGVTEVIVYVYDAFNLLVGLLGNDHSAALKSNGSAWAWGSGANGRLGDNTAVNKSSPVAVVGGHSFVKISCGSSHTTALKADGSAWAWGVNTSFGKLGDNTLVDKSSPVPVVGGHSFVQTLGAANHTTALKADGSAWSWGLNTSGQLGDNTVVNKSSPIAVIGGHSFIQIAPGASTCMALKADGSAWGWGVNTSGQLGDNTAINKSSPVAVIGGHSFIQISTGAYTAALKADGSVWTWGSNSNGELGDNTVISRSSPVAVVGGHSFIQVMAGGSTGSSVIALKADGSAWAWGANNVGQLGDNTIINKSSPVAVVGGHSFIQVSVSTSAHSAALKADGSIWTWGNNASGQLADNATILSKSSPVAIVGGHLFEAGIKFTNKKTFTVTPGTTYNISSFSTRIGNQLMASNAQNNSYIVLEYYG